MEVVELIKMNEELKRWISKARFRSAWRRILLLCNPNWRQRRANARIKKDFLAVSERRIAASEKLFFYMEKVAILEGRVIPKGSVRDREGEVNHERKNWNIFLCFVTANGLDILFSTRFEKYICIDQSNIAAMKRSPLFKWCHTYFFVQAKLSVFTEKAEHGHIFELSSLRWCAFWRGEREK